MKAPTVARLVGASAALAVLAGLGVVAERAADSAPASPAAGESTAGASPSAPRADTGTAPTHPFTGMWITADGHIRQELLPDGRYEEARGGREKAYTGRYTVDGNHIDYLDDTGFTATGDVRDGVLYHEHLVLYREGDPRIRTSGTGNGG